ncbi:hypothetical protein [Bradyrhizobium sp. AZCC 2289]|uniref:hypothetical protein n=1 Tax=Bradyrhizobium sp. AZCC 2289 TaxID=3117026 RepID=UPI002FF0B535
MEEIVSLAALQLRIDSPGSDRHPLDMEVFKNGLARFNAGDCMMLMVAAKLLAGKPYCVTSDNPETISRCRSLAEHMGASVQEIRADGIITRIILGPPCRQ